MRGAEGRGLIEEHDGKHILQTDVGNVAVIDDRGFIGGNAHGNLLDLIGLEGVFFAQTFERIEGRLNGGTNSPLFDVGAHDLVALAQLVDKSGGIGFGQAGKKEIIGARKGVADARPAGLNQQRGRDAVACRHASEHEGFLEMRGVALPESDAGGLLRGIVEQPAHLLGVQIGRATSRGGGAEAFGEAVGVAMRFVHEVLTAKRHGNAGADVITQSDGAQKLRAADGETLSRRECGGHHGAARMRQRRRVRIVGFVGLSEHAIGERRFDGTAEEIRADHRGHFFAAVRSRELNGGATGGRSEPETMEASVSSR